MFCSCRSHRSYIDDRSCSLFFHDRNDLLAKNKRCCKICSKHCIPFIHCDLIHIGSCSTYTCIIYKYINLSKCIQCCLNKILEAFIRCYICLAENSFSTCCFDFLCYFFSKFFLGSNYNYFCTFFCKKFCGCSSDSSCRSCNNRYFIL